MKNWNCENDKCTDPNGEVRLLPNGGGANSILCRSCYEHEIRYRQGRNKKLHPDERFATPKWESLEVYEA